MKDDDTVIYAAGDLIYFQFKKGGNMGLFIGGTLVLVILAGVGYVFYRRRQTTV